MTDRIPHVEDVTRKLIGEIQPVGEENEDWERYKNLMFHEGVVKHLIHDIVNVSHFKEDDLDSRKQAGRESARYLIELKNWIIECLESE